MQPLPVINKRRWDSYIFLTAVPGLLLIVIPMIVDFSSWTESEVNVDADTIYVSSATLIGLATFGSVLGIKLVKGLKAQKRNYMGIGIISVSVMMVIILQWFIMLQACCMDFDSLSFVIWQVGTLGYLMGIIAGFAFILESSLNLESEDSATPSSQS